MPSDLIGSTALSGIPFPIIGFCQIARQVNPSAGLLYEMEDSNTNSMSISLRLIVYFLSYITGNYLGGITGLEGT